MSAAAELARGNDLTITITPRGSEYEISVRLPPARVEREPNPRTRRASGLIELNKNLRADLEEVCTEFKGDLGGRDGPAYRALKKLYETGRQYWAELFGSDDEWLLHELQTRLDHRGDPLNVEVKTPADLTIPGEILPLGYRPSGTDIGEWARKLTAFRAVVRTTLTEPRDSTTQTTPESAGDDAGLIDQEHVLYGAPELPLLFLWDPSAPASALTRDLLESHRAAERILLDGPYPAADAHNEPESLAALLVDPPQVHTSSVRGITPYQIVHVNTHATVGRRASIRAFSEFHLAYYAKERGLLRRSRPLRVPVVVTNAHLTAAFDEVRYRARNRSRGNAPLRSRGPVAFFNACGAVASPEHGAAAFVNSFLSFGYRAVIGPRVDVPGILAHQMWEGFLKSLLNHRPVGLALYDARAGLLYAENTKNPLGALMTLYGEANLALRPALEP